MSLQYKKIESYWDFTLKLFLNQISFNKVLPVLRFPVGGICYRLLRVFGKKGKRGDS